ncbi:hypothetical protein [Pseudanabaena sp. ABRG5-3]|nr:hypothetical protein [Pseudanabaena sp. ABRG5-3]
MAIFFPHQEQLAINLSTPAVAFKGSSDRINNLSSKSDRYYNES